MRCFVAIRPPPEVLDALAELPRPATDGLRWSTRDQWHVTLRFFGDLSPADLIAASQALALVVGRLAPPVDASGGPTTRFLGPGLVVWPVEGLANVARAVEQATAGTGQAPADRKFRGHLTIGRGRRGTDLRKARQLLAPLAMAWPVGSLSLVESRLGPAGAKYTVIQELPFGGPRPPRP
ncbi:MAG: 2'-5' RNA ligase family protein [Acidimicrobiales bacterium]